MHPALLHVVGVEVAVHAERRAVGVRELVPALRLLDGKHVEKVRGSHEVGGREKELEGGRGCRGV